jgi:hypothetical protein
LTGGEELVSLERIRAAPGRRKKRRLKAYPDKGVKKQHTSAERDGEYWFKEIEQRNPPGDQGKSVQDTHMGLAIVIWDRRNVTALRWVGCASVPMDISGMLLNKMFDEPPRGSHVDLIIETHEVREAVKMCSDIIVQGWENAIYC